MHAQSHLRSQGQAVPVWGAQRPGPIQIQALYSSSAVLT